MKLKQFFFWLGLKPKPKEYGWSVEKQSVDGFGELEYANWLHPKMGKFKLTRDKIDALRSFLSPGDVAIDIGAHGGDTAVIMALAVGKTGTVFAVEPNKYVYKVLEANCRLNPGHTNIIPLNYAAAKEDGELEFRYSDPGFCNGGKLDFVSDLRHAHFFTLKVQGKDIEALLREKYPDKLKRLKYVKVDAEGSDFAVMKVLEPLVREFRPFVRTEIYKHMPKEEREKYYDYLCGLGYEIRLSDGEHGPGNTRCERGALMNEPTFDIWAIPAP